MQIFAIPVSLIVGLVSSLVWLLMGFYYLKFLPILAWDAWNWLWKRRVISLYTKLWGSLMMPIVAILGCPIGLLCLMVAGFNQGMVTFLRGGSVVQSWKSSFTAHRCYLTFLSNKLRHLEPDPLPEGFRPWSLGVFRTINAMLGLVVCLLTIPMPTTLLYYLFSPVIMFNAIKNAEWSKELAFSLVHSILIVVLWLVSLPLVPLGTILYSIMFGLYQGYCFGPNSVLWEADEAVMEWAQTLMKLGLKERIREIKKS